MFWSLKHEIKTRLQSVVNRLEKLRYSHLFREIANKDDSGQFIAQAIHQGRPCLIARLGSVESRLLGEALYRDSRWSRQTLKEAHRNAGIFPVDSTALAEVAACLKRGLARVDLLAQWQSPYQTRLIIDLLPKTSLRCDLSAVEPWWMAVPWTSALVGKKVLVVHPFDLTIQRQYLKREDLFCDSAVLPPFDLITLRPPQTIGFETEGFG